MAGPSSAPAPVTRPAPLTAQHLLSVKLRKTGAGATTAGEATGAAG
jgi:hypothetical protein